MNRWAGKVAVITGASSGIGFCTAKALVQKGMIVIGLARRKAKMEEGMKKAKGPGQFHARECDVTSEENVIKVFDEIKNTFGSVHVLVNNAGMMSHGSMIDKDTEQMEQCIKVNILGLLYCIKQAAKIMREGDQEGHIINVGSVLGHKVLNVENFLYNIYGATKFAVRALSDNLQNELGQGTKIRVTHVSPGAVKTEFFEVASADPSFLQNLIALDPEDVADAICYAIGTKPHVLISEISLRYLKERYV